MADSRAIPRVAILATGGTIAAAAAKNRQYQAGQFTVSALLQALPDLSPIASLDALQVANIGSQDINYTHWRDLHTAINKIAAQQQADAIVITHGTDTLEETAWFLHLTLDRRLPVVITGAMKPPHAVGADGLANLVDAITLAAHPLAQGKGVLATFNGKIYDARNLAKVAASGLEAFAAPAYGAIGTVADGRVAMPLVPALSSGMAHPFFASLPDTLPFVPVLYAHADMDERYLQPWLNSNPPGLVLAGLGNGNIAENLLPQLANAASCGVVVVRASRCGSGRVERQAEIDDKLYGFVVAADHTPQKARVLLQLLLAHTNNPVSIQEVFNAV